MRPANVVTSVSDVLAGTAISGVLFKEDYTVFVPEIILLCLSTVGLYGGGVVFNDVFDAELDRSERPERPIPLGLVSRKEASIFGSGLLLSGIVLGILVSMVSGLFSLAIAIAALIYNKWGKHHSFLGPLNMGVCRGLNLLLGVSILSPALSHWWFLAWVPIIYIAAITMISRGEVHGGNKTTLYFAAILYCIVIATILFFSIGKEIHWWALLFLIAFAWMIFRALIKAIQKPVPGNIGNAVKSGVLALILMNASWAVAFGAIDLAFIIILLLPLSLWLARLFAVT